MPWNAASTRPLTAMAPSIFVHSTKDPSLGGRPAATVYM